MLFFWFGKEIYSGKNLVLGVETSYMTMSRWIFMQVDVDVELNPSNLSLCTPMENTFCQLRCSSTKTKTRESDQLKLKVLILNILIQKPKQNTTRSKEASLNLLYPFFLTPFFLTPFFLTPSFDCD